MSDDLTVLGPIYETSMSPEHIDELMLAWEQRLEDFTEGGEGLALLGSASVLPHVERARQIMARMHGGDQRFLNDSLAATRLAAFILTLQGVVVAANAAAQECFNLYPGDSIRRRVSASGGVGEVARWIDQMIQEGRQGSAVLPMRQGPEERLRIVSVFPTRTPSGQTKILVCTSDMTWPDEMNQRLVESFGLTAAESSVLRQLSLGDSVQNIARGSSRKESTVRSQVHALMEKTGAKTQSELLRLVNVVMASMAMRPGPNPRPTPARADISAMEGKSAVHLRDGRRIEYFQFGREDGKPVIWLQSTTGVFRPTPDQEAGMATLGLRVVVPLRAGFGNCDPIRDQSDPLGWALRDTLEVMDILSITSAAFVAPADDIRIALMLARAAPARVSRILALGPGFPIRNAAQYRRMHRAGRFFRACARHAPAALPFIAGAFRTMMLRTGIEGAIQRNLAASPGDLALLQNRDVAEAFIGGFTYLYGAGTSPEQAFCAELRALHDDWPEELGHVSCPVKIFHGAEDANAPVETAREYAALYPGWEIEVVPGVGQLLIHKHWPEVLSVLAAEVPDQAQRASVGRAAR